jgi:serpin B
MRPQTKIWMAWTMAVVLVAGACGTTARGLSGPATRSKLARVVQPDAPSADVGALVDSNTAFALDLYAKLRTQPGNVAFSPQSISTALTMVSTGASGRTLAQTRSVLHLTLPPDRLYQAANALDLLLTADRTKPNDGTGDPLTLRIANSVWAQRGYPFLSDYLDVLARDFGAGMYLSDFRRDAEGERVKINGWIDAQTNGKIRDLIPKGTLDDLTRMVLVDAVYFKASWVRRFDASSTKSAPFHPSAGADVDVAMMHASENLVYASGEGWQAVDLPYIGDASMTLLVPDRATLPAFEQALTPSRLATIIRSLTEHPVDLTLPKFSVAQQTPLKDVLTAMGMTDAFEPPANGQGADFTGMTGAPVLYLKSVLHQATVTVDERGTVAAAATAAVFETTGALLAPPVTLVVDRPFIFLIRDTKTGAILFMGRVTNPQG